MKTCAMCEAEKEQVTLVQVVPATWNGFHNWVEVCAECQETRKFKLASKPKGTVRRIAGTTAAAPPAAAPTGPAVQISHRRTGALIHTVEGATLAGAALAGVALPGANLTRADLHGTDLQRADLRLADLSDADLRGADLRGANLRGADLHGADLREARLARADLNQAVYNNQTAWPTGVDPRAFGALKEA